MLSIVENLKNIRTILLYQKFKIYTDHKNLICKNFNTNRVLRWILLLKEYGMDVKYIKGEKNIVAYALSIFPLNGNQETTQKSTYQKEIVSEINNME